MPKDIIGRKIKSTKTRAGKYEEIPIFERHVSVHEPTE